MGHPIWKHLWTIIEYQKTTLNGNKIKYKAIFTVTPEEMMAK